PGAAELTFASGTRRVLIANVKSKTALESLICWCPFGSDTRKSLRSNTVRMQNQGHRHLVVACFKAKWNSVDKDKTRSLNILGPVARAECAVLLHSHCCRAKSISANCVGSRVFTISRGRFSNQALQLVLALPETTRSRSH